MTWIIPDIHIPVMRGPGRAATEAHSQQRQMGYRPPGSPRVEISGSKSRHIGRKRMGGKDFGFLFCCFYGSSRDGTGCACVKCLINHPLETSPHSFIRSFIQHADTIAEEKMRIGIRERLLFWLGHLGLMLGRTFLSTIAWLFKKLSVWFVDKSSYFWNNTAQCRYDHSRYSF